eukprot:TRINITY_DN517_c0_g2_i11.p1 TRINITY_DN517_c0_g2~~TRINITY_DN517_c0_g2_i11.p1  ORF type:complete len:568 (-),score=196.92 TRINITY_DN517_c0_g2_i11:508-2211(-)
MIQLNPRVGSKVDLLKPLLELFAAAYAPECMPEIEEVLRNHQSLRDELVNPLPYCGDIKNCEGYITKGKDYLALSAAIFRCVSPSALKVELRWTDSVSGKQILLGGMQSEQVTVIFNIAIFTYNQARIMSEAGNYKDAMSQFLIASAILGKVRAEASTLKINEIDVNFSEPYLQLAMNLCKAMAQLCVIEMKRAELLELPKLALSKICKYASDLFHIVYVNATFSGLPLPMKKIISPNFVASLVFGYKLYNGLACFYAARVYGDDTINKDPMKTMGYAVGLLVESTKMFKELKDMKGVLAFVKNVYIANKDFVEVKTKYIEQRNREIYREHPATKLPFIEALGHPKKVNLDEVFQSSVPGRDALRRTIPIKVVNYEKEYKGEVEKLKDKAKEAEKEYEKEEKKFFETHELVQRLFDAQDIQNNYEFPKELLNKLEKVHKKESIQGLIDFYEDIIGETANWNYFVSRCDQKLAEEEKKYKANKEAKGAAWTQKPSSEVNRQFKEGVKEGKEMMTMAKSQCELFRIMLKSESEEQKLLVFVSGEINDLMADIPKSIVITEKNFVEFVAQ